ncbi:hypothetical protein JOC54_001620 [Alkalihalobacillus xiaoxiensis]|uniref:GerA spore germination protein n=1 Tax=Shouchella xiaoxiensis TaxID=766895 RepID=A0ABS2SS82_9BACI|nr:spore germination protein [Shouchella xiaoxiensis]MBM7838364.1 hypothetical protein [Shouchella xiaoxiensis]
MKPHTKFRIEDFKRVFGHSDDVKFETYYFDKDKKEKLEIIYCRSIVDVKSLRKDVVSVLHEMVEEQGYAILQQANQLGRAQLEDVSPESSWDELAKRIFSGEVFFLIETYNCLYSVLLAQFPKRRPEESNTEISFRGPRDGFTEDVEENIALVRKRLRTKALINESFTVGKRGQTQLSLLYMKDVARPEIINEARTRIKQIDTDSVLSLAEIEERMSNTKFTFFPLTVFSSRPDFVAACLENGRFVVITDGSPGAVIAPVNLMFVLKTAEDLHNSFLAVVFQRLLRVLGLVFALFLPGFWIALNTFHVDQLPLPFLATIFVSRLGLPISSTIEIFLMLVLFELFREAGTTLPKSVGQTLAVVGGLIIGDAAIRAGLTSPTMLVVVGLTVVSTFAITSQVLSGTISIMRIYVLILSAFLGMFGFCIGVISVILYLASLESFGLPYLSPLSPFSKKDFVSGLLAKPWMWRKRRPKTLHTVDSTRRRDEW